MFSAKACRFAEVAWVTVLGWYYGVSALFLVWTLLGRLLPLHVLTDYFKPDFRFVSVTCGVALVVGMVWLGQEFYRRNPKAIIAARLFLCLGIVYSLLGVGANVWFLCIHAHLAPLLYLAKSAAMLVGNTVLVMYFLKLPRTE
jgi:hypothetical protein